MTVRIEPSWKAHLQDQFEQPYWQTLTAFVREEYAAGPRCPAGKDIFRAFDLTPFDDVKVVILGQDPYHTPGAAMGLCFSIPDGTRPQPSLRNIIKELASDVGVQRTHTDLSDWAQQGVFLLNSVLTVERSLAASHQKRGWETFTDAIIRAVNDQPRPVVFILWGSYAQKKAAFVDQSRHLVLRSAHPSPLSAHNGFFGTGPFSKANAFLEAYGRPPIDWALPPL